MGRQKFGNAPSRFSPHAAFPATRAMSHADDLLADDLLDELNGLLSDDEPSKGSRSDTRAYARTDAKPSSAVPNGTADIDSLLADLDSSPSAPTSTKYSASKAPDVARPSLAHSSSGVGSASSIGSLGFPSSADDDNATNLRCRKCDFRVLRFTDHKWTSDVDYMFFRNFVPNTDKLRKKLQAADGWSAYACQCSWTSAEFGTLPQSLPWFLSK